MIGEPFIADGVAAILCMLTAIDLDNQPALATHEIGNIRPNRLLTHKSEPIEPA
jgi:hypothetical protein